MCHSRLLERKLNDVFLVLESGNTVIASWIAHLLRCSAIPIGCLTSQTESASLGLEPSSVPLYGVPGIALFNREINPGKRGVLWAEVCNQPYERVQFYFMILGLGKYLGAIPMLPRHACCNRDSARHVFATLIGSVSESRIRLGRGGKRKAGIVPLLSFPYSQRM